MFIIVNLLVDIAHALLDPAGARGMKAALGIVLRKRWRGPLRRCSACCIIVAARVLAAILAPLLATHPDACAT